MYGQSRKMKFSTDKRCYDIIWDFYRVNMVQSTAQLPFLALLIVITVLVICFMHFLFKRTRLDRWFINIVDQWWCISELSMHPIVRHKVKVNRCSQTEDLRTTFSFKIVMMIALLTGYFWLPNLFCNEVWIKNACKLVTHIFRKENQANYSWCCIYDCLMITA